MGRHDHILNFFILTGCILFGVFATVVLSILILLAAQIPYAEIEKLSTEGIDELPVSLIRLLLLVQHLGIFIISGLLYGLVVYRRKIWYGLGLAKAPTITLSILGIGFLMLAYPLVNLSFLLNESIPLPEWASKFEGQAEETLRSVLAMNSPVTFLINLMVIAILPGIGEELLFRGIIQKYLGDWIKSPIVAIWITAIIFSAIHMQFEGFFPRVVLGAILGYLYYWTQNLWVPIITHAFNNGIQIALIYATGMDADAFEQQGSDQLEWWMIVLSVTAMFFIYRFILKKRQFIEDNGINHS